MPISKSQFRRITVQSGKKPFEVGDKVRWIESPNLLGIVTDVWFSGKVSVLWIGREFPQVVNPEGLERYD